MTGTSSVAAIVLAAGQSRRMGRAKQLLSWGDTTILGRTLEQLQLSYLADLLVVTGHRATGVGAVAGAYGVRSVFNPHYATGEMLSSLQVGLRQLPASVGAVLVVLADQPLVTTVVYDRLLAAYGAGCGKIIVPTYEGRRGNPVLFDGVYWPDLLALPAGARPRDVLQKYRADVYLLDVGSEAVLIDIDRPGVYERWRPS